jgi:hypothetical protein
MKRSGAIFMVVFGFILFGVAAGFMLTNEPLEPTGRSDLPAVVLAVFSVIVGVAAIIYGIRGLRGSGSAR